jgi:hypothetical protein
MSDDMMMRRHQPREFDEGIEIVDGEKVFREVADPWVGGTNGRGDGSLDDVIFLLVRGDVFNLFLGLDLVVSIHKGPEKVGIHLVHVLTVPGRVRGANGTSKREWRKGQTRPREREESSSIERRR